MKCLRCNLVNPSTTNICKRCQNSLFGNTTALSGNQGMIYHDPGFLVIENKTTLPKRCYRCNSRKIVGMKTQTLEYTPALEQALEFAVGALIPIPVPLSLVSRKKTIRLDLCFCHRHRSYHRILFKVGWGILIFSFLCFAVSMYAVDYPNGFLYSVITAVAAFCVGVIVLYIEKENEIVSLHRYQAPYFWIEGFGDEYLRCFPDLINSPPR